MVWSKKHTLPLCPPQHSVNFTCAWKSPRRTFIMSKAKRLDNASRTHDALRIAKEKRHRV